MFREEKNLKDPEGKSLTSYGAGSQNSSFIVSYRKTDKLITALYMVTDIIDKDEPLRNKLRTLGVEIISDTHSLNILTRAVLAGRINELMSFLDIATAVGIVSLMNSNILRKEFVELNQSIKESSGNVQATNRQINLSEFFKDSADTNEELIVPGKLFHVKGHYPAIGHHTNSTRIGVQKADTLLKALNGLKHSAAPHSANKNTTNNKHDFEQVKKERESQIINIIKIIGTGATIKDIKDKAQANPAVSMSLISCSEKTLQRELVYMVQSGVLKKTGEKRWSKYAISSSS